MKLVTFMPLIFIDIIYKFLIIWTNKTFLE
jgi:hypothetical protein